MATALLHHGTSIDWRMESIGRHELHRSVMWQRHDRPGAEYCELLERPSGWTLRGDVVVTEEAGPACFRYEISCDRSWETRRVSVEARRDAQALALTLEVDSDRQWWRGGAQMAALRGCIDVDLGFSPATNTIALRRLSMREGEAATLTAAWVRPSDLAARPLRQRYARVNATTYEYRSESGFATRLDVDDLGLVTAYPSLWTRVAQRR